MSLQKILNPAGGLFYHMRALRYGPFLWRPYIKMLEPLLLQWTVPTKQLVIVGSSSGYSLTNGFLQRFTSVVIVEPDPLARCVFRLRFPFTNAISDSCDYIAPMDGIDTLIAKYPGAAILFSNILGQRYLICKRSTDEARRNWLAALPVKLDRCHWFTYHDRISTFAPLINSQPLESPHELSPDDLMDYFCGPDKSTTYTNHETSALGLPNANRIYLPWMLKPSRLHIIEVIIK